MHGVREKSGWRGELEREHVQVFGVVAAAGRRDVGSRVRPAVKAHRPAVALNGVAHRKVATLQTCRIVVPGPTELDSVAEDFLAGRDRKSTRLNSSHQIISYAVFCLKKKKL